MQKKRTEVDWWKGEKWGNSFQRRNKKKCGGAEKKGRTKGEGA